MEFALASPPVSLWVIYATYQREGLTSGWHLYSYVYDRQLRTQLADFSICEKKYAYHLLNRPCKMLKMVFRIRDSFIWLLLVCL